LHAHVRAAATERIRAATADDTLTAEPPAVGVPASIAISALPVTFFPRRRRRRYEEEEGAGAGASAGAGVGAPGPDACASWCVWGVWLTGGGVWFAGLAAQSAALAVEGKERGRRRREEEACLSPDRGEWVGDRE
ncbi:MAG: hypothetical protein LQ346_005969, partial [Caloplaca aetnensis]